MIICSDLKWENILVRFDHDDEAITKFLEDYPSATYEPRIEPSFSPDPITTVKSQPLPNFNLRDDLSNVNICLIDFGTGE
jgi:serine/threonine-protein kinase SRPK3